MSEAIAARTPAISPRVLKAVEILAVEGGTITAAAAAVGLSRVTLSRALSKPHVASHVKRRIEQLLRASALRGAARMDQLLHSPNEMVSYRASAFALGAGMGIGMPAQGNVAVQVSVDSVGYVIDLSGGRSPRPVLEHEVRTIEHVEGEPVIDHDDAGERGKP